MNRDWIPTVDSIDDFGETLIDDLSLRDSSNGSQEAVREREADELAEMALINEDAWVLFNFPGAATNLRIAELAITASVHPSVVAGRVRFETRNCRRFGGLIGHGDVRKFFPRDGVYSGAD